LNSPHSRGKWHAPVEVTEFQMRRLIIHAGFPKTGSSSIQNAIGRYLPVLNARDYYMFGKDMRVGRDGVHPGLPLWFIENAAKNFAKGETLMEKVRSGLADVGDDAALLLTAENLEHVNKPRLFVGADQEAEVTVVFYMRPQVDWIPSAWKQWAMKRGIPLGAFVKQCRARNRPQNLASLETWAKTLPSAKIIVRPFFRDAMAGGNPAVDFFTLIGFEEFDADLLAEPVNPSMDYSLLHVMMRNAKDLFEGIHDNKLERRLSGMLPEYARATNAPMLSNEAAAQVEAHFRDENLHILRTYGGIEDAEAFYRTHYLPSPTNGTSYMDADEAEVLARGFRILMEAMGTDRAAAVLGSMIRNEAED
jgi:hypothetical protein